MNVETIKKLHNRKILVERSEYDYTVSLINSASIYDALGWLGMDYFGRLENIDTITPQDLIDSIIVVEDGVLPAILDICKLADGSETCSLDPEFSKKAVLIQGPVVKWYVGENGEPVWVEGYTQGCVRKNSATQELTVPEKIEN